MLLTLRDVMVRCSDAAALSRALTELFPDAASTAVSDGIEVALPFSSALTFKLVEKPVADKPTVFEVEVEGESQLHEIGKTVSNCVHGAKLAGEVRGYSFGSTIVEVCAVIRFRFFCRM